MIGNFIAREDDGIRREAEEEEEETLRGVGEARENYMRRRKRRRI